MNRQLRSNSKDVQLSKSLSWLLRHGAPSQGLSLSVDGYVEVSKILTLTTFKSFSLEDIKRVVDTNDKKRFSIRNNSLNILEIRANQGHTIQVDEEKLLVPIVGREGPTTGAHFPPNGYRLHNVIHGTYYRFWDSIKINGLSKMKRNHIHFANVSEHFEVISGMRKDCEIQIYLNVEKVLTSGIPLFLSENGVVLSPGDEEGYIRPEHFEKAIDVKTGVQLK